MRAYSEQAHFTLFRLVRPPCQGSRFVGLDSLKRRVQFSGTRTTGMRGPSRQCRRGFGPGLPDVGIPSATSATAGVGRAVLSARSGHLGPGLKACSRPAKDRRSALGSCRGLLMRVQGQGISCVGLKRMLPCSIIQLSSQLRCRTKARGIVTGWRRRQSQGTTGRLRAAAAGRCVEPGPASAGRAHYLPSVPWIQPRDQAIRAVRKRSSNSSMLPLSSRARSRVL